MIDHTDSWICFRPLNCIRRHSEKHLCVNKVLVFSTLEGTEKISAPASAFKLSHKR